MDSWLPWVGAAVVAFLILKFVFKPLFKVLALVALAAVVWWYFGDQITAWLSLMN